ncbi:ribosome-associated translation inhibitor RaiA [Candidatus Wolfebacteria bacterium]|nr:ribosome-associated translation inhibitor RaiA [Candidatus Wolfebacteria bacterium]
MKIHIKATGFDLTPALKNFIEEKFNTLDKFVEKWNENDAVLLRIEVARKTNHHNKGDVFYAEVNLDLPGLEVVRIEDTGEDMYAAIISAKDRLKTDLLKIKERLSEHK